MSNGRAPSYLALLTHRERAPALAASLLVWLAAMLATPVGAASLVEVTSFGSNPGNLRMFKYVPDALPTNKPLVVVLHGSTHTADQYDNETGWVKYAEEWDFALLLPEQKPENSQGRAFLWFESTDNQRGQGEPLSIKQMVDKMIADHSVDPSRVYVTGLSAGAAMASVMMATYPDVFAGGAPNAGVPYGCANNFSEGTSCAFAGKNLTPQQWGDHVRNAFPGYNGPWPKMTIWHGDQDTTANFQNSREYMEQWTNVHGIDQTPEVEDTVRGYPHEAHKNANGDVVVERYTITGMGHAVPVDPGTQLQQCGVASQFFQDVNICAAYHTALFWGLNQNDTQAPTVSITSPSGGASVSGTVTIQASASDNVGVTRVEFLVDGRLIETDTSSPYQAQWSTGSEANGGHTLHARAFDTAGNNATSNPVSVTVTGGVSDTTPPTANLTFPANGATVSGTITLSATASDDFGVARVEFFVDGISVGTGTPSGEAGPWTAMWDTTTVANGPHALKVEARDAAGNVGTDDDTSVTVSQTTPVLRETFSDADANGDYFDNTGWTAGGYEPNADNHNLSTTAESKATFGYASSGVGCATGLKTETLSRSVALANNPQLSYFRKLDLKAFINAGTSAYLRVKVNGTVVDDKTVTFADYVESNWTERSQISLASWASQTVTLAFEVGATSNTCVEVFAKAWLDDIEVKNPQDASDTTPPTVNVTAPANGATVSGAVDITASASDNVGVGKVEFYVDGSLLQTDLSSPYAMTWNTGSVANGSHALMAKAYDAAGNVGSDDDTSVTVSNSGGGEQSVTLDNSDANDGYVQAYADGSGSAVGTAEDLYGLAIGRGSNSKFNRTVLSFDTSSLPDTATITRAYLTVSLNSYYSDPWADPAGNQLVIDVKNGCFGTCTIAASDWAASPTQSAVAQILKWITGTTNSTNLNAAGLGAINKTGTTQFKLRFTGLQSSMKYIFIAKGVSVKLTIEYIP